MWMSELQVSAGGKIGGARLLPGATFSFRSLYAVVWLKTQTSSFAKPGWCCPQRGDLELGERIPYDPEQGKCMGEQRGGGSQVGGFFVLGCRVEGGDGWEEEEGCRWVLGGGGFLMVLWF